MELRGRTALVTGAGRGIGRAIALALAAEGMHVGLLARSRAELEAVAREIAGANLGVRSCVAPADVADRAAVEAAVARVREELGPIDTLINNAGMAAFGTVLEMDPELWERIVRVNVLGTYHATRAVLPAMMEARRGDIVNVASTAGQKGAARASAYGASKAAVLNFTEALMPEARKHDVRVTALIPSTVNTELAAELGLDIGPEDRMMQPEDVAAAVVAALRLPARVFVRDLSLLTTNPA